MKYLELYNKLLNDKENIIASESGNYITFKYKNMGVNFQEDYIRLARGLTFNSGTKELITLGFEKFFNKDQLLLDKNYSSKFKKEYSSIDLDKIKSLTIQEKLDGSLIVVGLDSSTNKLVFSSTGTTNSKHSIKAEEIINYKIVHDYLSDNPHICLIFELLWKDEKIVVDYKEDELILLSATDKRSLSRLSYKEVDQIAKELKVFNRPKLFHFTKESLYNFLTKATNFEGFVIENEYGNLVKMKTEEYIYLHSIYGTSLRFRVFNKSSISNMVDEYFNETLDDTLANLISSGNILAATNLQTIQNEINNIQQTYHKLKLDYKNYSKKDWFTRTDLSDFEKGLPLYIALTATNDKFKVRLKNYLIKKLT